MERLPQNVITSEVDSEETTLQSPRFDEVAARMARPVVPLSEEVLSADTGHPANLSSTRAPLLYGKGPWLLAAVACLILTAGAMAIGLTAYRRNQVVPAQPLAPVAEAARVEIDQYPRPGQASRSSTPAIAGQSLRSNTNTAAIQDTKKRVQPARPVRPAVTDRPASTDKSKPRMVDSYVIRSSRP